MRSPEGRAFNRKAKAAGKVRVLGESEHVVVNRGTYHAENKSTHESLAQPQGHLSEVYVATSETGNRVD